MTGYLAASLLAVVPASAADDVVVPAGATWSYLDDGTDQGGAWTDPAFDDTGWATGPAELGYGDGDEATVVSYGPLPADKYVTTYFRHAFTVVDAASYRWMDMRLRRDDGAVIHLNGTEIGRSNMPAGPITFTTLADTRVQGNAESVWRDLSVETAGLLVDGSNVVAVEIHQARVWSSDISMDLEVTLSDRLGRLVRGPYLQQVTPDGIVLRWHTDEPTDSVVDYGPAPGNLPSSVFDAVPTTDHEIALSGLSAGTRYHYAVGHSQEVLAGDDADHWFETAPPVGTATPTRIWVLGDSGTANANAAAVRDAYQAWGGGAGTQVWLMLGDNAYPDGTQKEYQAAVFGMYPGHLRNTVLWPTLGNHDAHSADSPSGTGPYYDIFTLPTAGEAGGEPSGTEAYYSFDHGNIHLICLDSTDTDRSPEGAMMTWLEADLLATTQDWIIAFWHHPPYSKGSHDSDFEGRLVQMRRNALPILEGYGVDLVLAGHSHSYERTMLLDGHYGQSWTLDASVVLDPADGQVGGQGAYAKPPGVTPHEGAVYITAGSSGKVSPAPLDHPAMVTSMAVLGSVVVDVVDDRMTVSFVDAQAGTADRFSIHKDRVCPEVLMPLVAGPSCCGDGVCAADEDSDGCPSDCGPGPFCHDGTCDANEDACSCPADCAPIAELTCDDAFDDDCDGQTDCDDPDCAADAACICVRRGGPCVDDADCCGNACRFANGLARCML